MCTCMCTCRCAHDTDLAGGRLHGRSGCVIAKRGSDEGEGGRRVCAEACNLGDHVAFSWFLITFTLALVAARDINNDGPITAFTRLCWRPGFLLELLIKGEAVAHGILPAVTSCLKPRIALSDGNINVVECELLVW